MEKRGVEEGQNAEKYEKYGKKIFKKKLRNKKHKNKKKKKKNEK